MFPAGNFIKKEDSRTSVFCEFCEVFRNTFCVEHLQVTACVFHFVLFKISQYEKIKTWAVSYIDRHSLDFYIFHLKTITFVSKSLYLSKLSKIYLQKPWNIKIFQNKNARTKSKRSWHVRFLIFRKLHANPISLKSFSMQGITLQPQNLT